MITRKKWSTAAAVALTVALLGAGTVSASAAEGDVLNPQSNGSKGSFFLFDSEAVLANQPDRVFARGEYLFGAADSVDYLKEFNAAADRSITGSVPFTNVYRFLSDQDPTSRDSGTNTWKAWAVDSTSGPNGGTLTPEMTLESLTTGIETVIAAGGEYWYGIAYTTNNGVTVVGSVYREITIEAGTGNYTVGAVELEGPAPVEEIVEADLTPALEVPTLVTTTTDSTILAIDAGVANANKTLTVGAFSDLVDLGQITLDATGKGSVDVAGKGFAAGESHKLFLAESDDTIVAWASFTLAQTFATSDDTDLTVDVTTSNRFELIAPLTTSVDLGDVKRNKTTTAVALGEFSVIDDRDALLGWNVNVAATAFTGPNSATIANTALGYAPVAAGGTQTGVTLGAAKVAGEGAFGVLVGAAANSSTTEDGAHFNADLTFKAPVDAVKGAYNSTLTLDLVSK